VNVTVAADVILVKDSVKPTYVGEVDSNAPAPFSVSAIVDSGATEGEYRASIIVYYRDDLQLDHVITIPISFTVVSELPKTETGQPSVVGQLSNPLLLLGLTALIIILVIAVYVRRRRRKTPQT